MAQFKLEIFTPERIFFSGPVESLTVESLEGSLSVLSGHAPMVAALRDGRLVIRQNGAVLEAFGTAGFMEVLPHQTLVFCQKCEWPEEIDENRALADQEEAQASLLRKQSMLEYKESRIMLTRALTRLKIKNHLDGEL